MKHATMITMSQVREGESFVHTGLKRDVKTHHNVPCTDGIKSGFRGIKMGDHVLEISTRKMIRVGYYDVVQVIR